MNLENLEFKYNGFKVTDEQHFYLSERLESLKEEAPYNSFLSAQFNLENFGYSGLIKINSSRGQFIAKASSKNLKSLMHRLEHQLRRQISRWKSRRFAASKEWVEMDRSYA